jgi:hypothetical protein
MSTKRNALGGASAAGLSDSTGSASEAPSSFIAEHAALHSEATQHGTPATDAAEPTTKRFLKIEDIWM